MRALLSIIFLYSSIAQAQQELELWPDGAPPFSRPVEDLEQDSAGRDSDGTSQWIDLAANWLTRLN